MVSVYFWDAKWNYTSQGGNLVNCFVNYVSQNDKVGPNNKDEFQVKITLTLFQENKNRHIYWHFALQKSSGRATVGEYLKPER